jgi:hypothetical protein
MSAAEPIQDPVTSASGPDQGWREVFERRRAMGMGSSVSIGGRFSQGILRNLQAVPDLGTMLR